MKPVSFGYHVAASAAEAADVLDQAAGTAKLVAGAQSLGPMLNLRLARPERLVDVAMLPALRETRESPDRVTLGAAITHAEIEDGEVPDPTPGWLAAVAARIAHRAIRNRGTLGGSLAHADPAADWPVVMLALGASIIVEGPAGRREMAVQDFVIGPFQTRLEPNELIVSIEIPRPEPGARWAYWKYTRQVGEFAKASAAVLIDPGGRNPRIAIGALSGPPRLIEADMARRLVAGETDATTALAAFMAGQAPAGRALHVVALRNALIEAGAGAVSIGE